MERRWIRRRWRRWWDEARLDEASVDDDWRMTGLSVVKVPNGPCPIGIGWPNFSEVAKAAFRLYLQTDDPLSAQPQPSEVRLVSDARALLCRRHDGRRSILVVDEPMVSVGRIRVGSWPVMQD